MIIGRLRLRDAGPLERRYTQIAGFRIRSLHAGCAGRPVVLLHGLAGSHRWWRYVIPQLARDRAVIVPELVGFGGSRPAPRQPDMAEMADIVAEWLVANGLDRVDLVAILFQGFTQIVFHAHGAAFG